MNLGSIDNPKTQPARMYRILKGATVRGDWLSTKELAHAVGSYAPSTVISQVREQLPEGETIEHECGSLGGQTIHRYRLRIAAGQGALFADEPQPAAPWTGEPE